MGRSAFLTYGSYVGVSMLGLVNVLLVARVLGPVGRGDIAFLMAVAGLTAFMFNLSVQEANGNLAGLRPHRTSALVTNSLVLAGILGLGAAGTAVAALEYAPLLRRDVPDVDLFLALVSMPLLILQTYLVYLARGGYYFAIANWALLIAPITTLIANAGATAVGELTVTYAIGAWTAGNGLSVLALVVHALVRSGLGQVDTALAREAVGLGTRAHVGGVLATGSYRLDQWILGAAVGARELGIYSVAVAWFQGMFLLPQAVGAVIRPDMVRASKEEAARRAAALFRLTAVVTAVIGGGVVLLAPVLCAGVFGESFSDGAAPLRLLVAGAFGIVSLKILGNAMTAQGRPLLESAAMGAGFAVALTLYVTLIPWLGAEGAALASTIAYSVSGVVSARLLVSRFHVPARDLIPRPADIRILSEIGKRLVRRPAATSA